MGARRLDRRRRLYIVPFQWEWMLLEAGITFEEAEQAVWSVSPGGDRERGAAAVNETLDTLLGSHLFRRLYNLPLIKLLQDSIYGFVAENRSKFPGTTPAVYRTDGWKPQR